MIENMIICYASVMKQLSWYSPLKLQTKTNLHIKTQKTCWNGSTWGKTTKELLSQNLDHCIFVRVWKLANFDQNLNFRELYDIHNEITIQSIAIDDAIKGGVKLLQFSGILRILTGKKP